MIDNDDDFIHMSYTHYLNYSNKKELTLNGLRTVQIITEYFGGKFSYDNNQNEFIVKITFPIVKREYKF